MMTSLKLPPSQGGPRFSTWGKRAVGGILIVLTTGIGFLLYFGYDQSRHLTSFWYVLSLGIIILGALGTAILFAGGAFFMTDGLFEPKRLSARETLERQTRRRKER